MNGDGTSRAAPLIDSRKGLDYAISRAICTESPGTATGSDAGTETAWAGGDGAGVGDFGDAGDERGGGEATSCRATNYSPWFRRGIVPATSHFAEGTGTSGSTYELRSGSGPSRSARGHCRLLAAHARHCWLCRSGSGRAGEQATALRPAANTGGRCAAARTLLGELRPTGAAGWAACDWRGDGSQRLSPDHTSHT